MYVMESVDKDRMANQLRQMKIRRCNWIEGKARLVRKETNKQKKARKKGK